jgi:hypothetical protein
MWYKYFKRLFYFFFRFDHIPPGYLPMKLAAMYMR